MKFFFRSIPDNAIKIYYFKGNPNQGIIVDVTLCAYDSSKSRTFAFWNYQYAPQTAKDVFFPKQLNSKIWDYCTHNNLPFPDCYIINRPQTFSISEELIEDMKVMGCYSPFDLNKCVDSAISDGIEVFFVFDNGKKTCIKKNQAFFK